MPSTMLYTLLFFESHVNMSFPSFCLFVCFEQNHAEVSFTCSVLRSHKVFTGDSLSDSSCQFY